MRHREQRAILGAVLLTSVCALAAPAFGLTIFGIRLWGTDPAEEVEVIDPLPYSVTLTVLTEIDEVERGVQIASALWTERAQPASGRAGLIARARGDYRRILAALYNAGHYGPEISIRLAGREASEVTLADPLPAEVPVEIVVAPGPRFRFGIAELVGAPDWMDRRTGERVEDDPESVGFEVGRTARAAAVGAAAQLAIERWRALGHAKADETGRDIVADHATRLLEARVFLEPGRRAHYGPIAVDGARSVDADFIAYMAGLSEGDRFDPEELEEARGRLVRLGTFTLVQIQEGEEIAPDGSLPMTVRVEERLPRSFGIGATVSTLDGLGLEGFWLHRNLRGRAEQLRFDATVARIGAEQAPEDLTYRLRVGYLQPGVINPDTSFFTSLEGRQQDLDTYRERAVTFRLGLTRDFGPNLTGEVSLQVERSRVTDDAFGTRDFLTVGPVANAQWDRRDDALNATEGWFAAAQVGPFYELEFGNIAARGTTEGRIYRSLDEESRFVLASRARLGSYVGPDAAESPPDQLFFAGGGGSIRGYAFRSIGVDTGQDEVIGGRSLVDGSAELRTRFGARWGIVGFLDGGYVAENSGFGGDSSGWRFGTGIGARYFTGFGPIRVDLATPLNPRDQDPTVALYIGIGQSF